MNWDYIQPVEIHFGKGRVNEIKNMKGIRKDIVEACFRRRGNSGK